MSGLTVEYQLKSDNGIKYTIHIHDFDRKIKSFRSGRSIYSKHFWIGESSFSVQIYPNGDSAENKGNVSVFLQNENDWRVKVDCTFTVSDGCGYKMHSLSFTDDLIETRCGLGFPSYSPHNQIYKGGLLDENGLLSLEVSIKLLEEEVTTNRVLKSIPGHVKDVREEQQKQAEKLEVQTNKLEMQTNKLEEQGKAIQELSKLNEGLNAQKAEIQKLTAAMQAMTSSTSVNSYTSDTKDCGVRFRSGVVRTVEIQCPICSEDARPPMRLKQCINGHIICDSCFQKTQVEASSQRRTGPSERQGNPHLDLCHTCRLPVTGRPSLLEQLLGLN